MGLHVGLKFNSFHEWPTDSYKFEARAAPQLRAATQGPRPKRRVWYLLLPSKAEIDFALLSHASHNVPKHARKYWLMRNIRNERRGNRREGTSKVCLKGLTIGEGWNDQLGQIEWLRRPFDTGPGSYRSVCCPSTVPLEPKEDERERSASASARRRTASQAARVLR